MTTLKYRADIDGLRAFAVLPVILFHAGADWLPGGFIGVDIFFVISGYLISCIILREVQAGEFSFLRFYERRFRRIIPALLVVLIVTIFVFQVIALPDQAQSAAESGIAALLSLSNIYFWQQSGYFAPTSEFMPLLHTWSLAVEEQFYIVFPVFILLICWVKLSMKWALSIATVAALALGVSMSTAIPAAAYYLLPARAWELGLGAMIACGAIPPAKSPVLREGVPALGLAMIGFSLFWIQSDMAFPGWVALIPCIGAGLILYADGRSWTARIILSARPIVFVGLLSYSLYLWHWPVLASVRILNANAYLDLASAVAAITITSLLAFISWRFVETPFRNRKKMPAKRMLKVLGLGSVAVFCIAGMSILNSGFPGRLGESARIALSGANDIDQFRSICRGNENRDACNFGNADVSATIALVGDSHAAAIRLAIEKGLLNDDEAATLFWEGACPFLEGASLSNHAERIRCREFKTQAWAIIEADQQLETVILSARWPFAFTGYLPESGGSFRTFLIDAETEAPSVEENERVFIRSLGRTLDRLKALDLNVIIIGGVPEAGFNVPHIIAMAQYHGLQTPQGIPRNLVEERAGRVDSIIKNIVATRTGVSFISIWQKFCGPEWCRVEEDGVPIYSDDNHLSKAGATSLAAKAISQGEDEMYVQSKSTKAFR